jgi:D-xylose transport system ATP-binding protein
MAAEVSASQTSVSQVVELITTGRSGDIGLSTAAANASM